MMTIDLSGKTCLVTGAAGDLGRAIARTLAACGADVGIHYHTNKAKAIELCAELSAMGRRAVALHADVTRFDSVLKMQKKMKAELGDPDIVVTNAVVQYEWQRALDQPAEDYESQFRSSVLQNVFMTKAFVPAMIEKRWGRVIGINTECSTQCWPMQSAYVSGKHGMNGFLQTLAKEVGPHGVTVNQVAPGWMVSDRYRGRKLSKMEHPTGSPYARMLPLKHRGDDTDIANAVAFFASDLARFITGAFLEVNGGGATIPPWIE